MMTKWGNAEIDNKGYYCITSFKEGFHRKFLHRLIWEDFYKEPIPKDCVIHHKDGDKLNNCIMNLQLLSKKNHMSLHMKGENNPHYGTHLSETTKKKISNANKGKNSSWWNYSSRIVKNGKCNGIQRYSIKKDGKVIKSSISFSKLQDWFKKEYSDVVLEINIK